MRTLKIISIAFVLMLCSGILTSLDQEIEIPLIEQDDTPQTRGPFGVNVSGNVSDSQSQGTFMTWLAAFNYTTMQMINTTVTWDGNYSFFLPEYTKIILVMFPFSGKKINGYDLHGYFPKGKDVEINDTNIEVNFTLKPAYEIILEAYNTTGGLISEQNMTGIKFVTDSTDTVATAGAEYGFWTGSSNGMGFTAPSVIIEPDTKRTIWMQWEEPGFGRINLQIDNETNGFGGPAGGAEVVDANYVLARSINNKVKDKEDEYGLNGIPSSSETQSFSTLSDNYLSNANLASGMDRVNESNKCINASCWALEGLEMDRAVWDIEINRKGDLNINVKDTFGQPVEGAVVTINQTERDFLIGAYEPVAHIGREYWQQLRDIGVNFATAGFYWQITEPTEGVILYEEINNTIGVTDLHEMGFKIKAHALIYLLKYVVPDYLRPMNFTELNQTVYDHIFQLVDTYKDKIDIWNVVNEASAEGANMNLTKPQMVHLIKTGVQAIRDADPDSEIIVNNAFFWFSEHVAHSFLYGDIDEYSQPIHEFMDLLEAENVDYDLVGQQMYDGGFSSYFMDAGVGGPLTASTFDFTTMSEILDALEKYDKPVHITEQSVSGTWNESSNWDGAGWWHNKWDAQTQADFLTYYYTMVFSKPKAEAITWWNLRDENAFMKKGGWFDENLDPKPIFYALEDFIANHTTNTVGVTDENGDVVFRGYGGDYNVTVNYKGEILKNQTHITEQTSQSLNLAFGTGWRADLTVNQAAVEYFGNKYDALGTGSFGTMITIHNQGQRKAENVDLVVSFDVMKEENKMIKYKQNRSFPMISEGSLYAVNLTWDMTDSLGFLPNITVSLDPNNTVLESVETNNIYSEPIGTKYRESYSGTVYRRYTTEAITEPVIKFIGPTNRDLNPLDGSYLASDLDWGYYNISVKKDGYDTLYKEIFHYPFSENELDLFLEPMPGTLMGRIKNESGELVENATVRVVELNLTEVTTAHGKYNFPDLPYARYRLNVTANGYYPFEESYWVGLDKVSDITVTLIEIPEPEPEPEPEPDPSVIVYLWIENEYTGPIQGARVSLDGNYLGDSDNDGKYTFEFNTTGIFVIKVEKENYETSILNLIVSFDMNNHVQVSLNLTVAIYDGYVYDDYGQPVEGANVSIGDKLVMITDEFGYFDFGRVEFGEYELLITANGLMDYEELLMIEDPGKVRSTVYMESYSPYGTLEGQVIDEMGNPIPGATVTIEKYGYVRTTDQNGEFSIEEMDPNEYTLKAGKDGYITKESNIYITAGKTEKWTITLELEEEPVEEETGTNTVMIAGMVIAILAILIIIIIVIFAMKKVEPPQEADANAKEAKEEEEPEEEQAPAETAEDGSLMAESISDEPEEPEEPNMPLGKPPDEQLVDHPAEKRDMDIDLENEEMEDEFDQDMLGDIEFDVDVEEYDEMGPDEDDW